MIELYYENKNYNLRALKVISKDVEIGTYYTIFLDKTPLTINFYNVESLEKFLRYYRNHEIKVA